MAIEFNCPHCGKLLTTTESRALALAKCPSCNDLITVPAASEPVSVGPGPAERSPEFAATAAWSSAPTPGPGPNFGAPAPPFQPPANTPAPVATPAPAASPYSGYTVGPGGFPPPPAPTSPPVDGHAAPPHAVSPHDVHAAPPREGQVAPSGSGAPGAGAFTPMSPAAAVGAALWKAQRTFPQSAPGTGAPPFGPSGLHACPRCGQPAAYGAAYCAACGTPLSPAAYPLQFAGFSRRSAAAVIDLAIVSLGTLVVDIVLRGESWQAFFFVWFFYSAALESSREQATLGKRVLRMFVCGADGRRLTFARAAIRTLAKLASLAICGMGFIMPLMTPRRQALHDMLTDAVVVLS